MYYRIYEDGEAVGLIDLEHRTHTYTGSHSEVEEILAALDDGQYDYLLVEPNANGTPIEVPIPKTGAELRDELETEFSLAPEFAAEADPELNVELVDRTTVGEDNDRRPPEEDPEYLTDAKETEKAMQTADNRGDDLPEDSEHEPGERDRR